MDQKRPVIALRPGHRANKPSKPSAPRKLPTIVGPQPPLLPENGNPYAAAEKAEELCKELIRLCRKNSPGPAAAPKAVG